MRPQTMHEKEDRPALTAVLLDAPVKIAHDLLGELAIRAAREASLLGHQRADLKLITVMPGWQRSVLCRLAPEMARAHSIRIVDVHVVLVPCVEAREAVEVEWPHNEYRLVPRVAPMSRVVIAVAATTAATATTPCVVIVTARWRAQDARRALTGSATPSLRPRRGVRSLVPASHERATLEQTACSWRDLLQTAATGGDQWMGWRGLGRRW